MHIHYRTFEKHRNIFRRIKQLFTIQLSRKNSYVVFFFLPGYFKCVLERNLYIQFCILLLKNLPYLRSIFHYLFTFWIIFLEWSPRNGISETYRVLLNMKWDNGSKRNLKIEKHYTKMSSCCNLIISSPNLLLPLNSLFCWIAPA